MSDHHVFICSRRVLARDFSTQWCRERCSELNQSPAVMHRKIWEFAAICQVFNENFANLSEKLTKSLGFGCGKEPIPAWLAAQGSRVLATDAPHDNANWTSSGQRAAMIDDIPWRGICKQEDCAKNLWFSFVDMNLIPEELLEGKFDFTWSCGSFEHIGGIDASLNFFCRQMKALKPGGIAAHTTEYNFGSNDATINAQDLVLFRSQDLERLSEMLSAQGDKLYALDLSGGDLPEDRIVDEPPYISPVHLALRINQVHVSTSIILIAERGGI